MVNSDIEVSKDWLKPIIQQFKNEVNTAAIQPKIIDYKDKTKFEYAGAGGGFIDFFGYPFCKGRIFETLEKDSNQYDEIDDIFWASGACLFIRSSIFLKMNGFDEDYFAHMEEIDLCWRIKNEGFNIQYTGKSTVYHVGGATLNEYNPRKTFLNFKNSLVTILKNVPFPSVIFVIFTRLILDGIAGIRFLFDLKFSHTFAIIKAHFSFYWSIPKTLKKRSKISRKNKHYYYTFSIVWQYFARGRKTFKEIK